MSDDMIHVTGYRVLVTRTLKFKFIALRSKHTCINYYKCITYFQHTSCSFVFDQNALADGESGDFNQSFILIHLLESASLDLVLQYVNCWLVHSNLWMLFHDLFSFINCNFSSLKISFYIQEAKQDACFIVFINYCIYINITKYNRYLCFAHFVQKQ